MVTAFVAELTDAPPRVAGADSTGLPAAPRVRRAVPRAVGLTGSASSAGRSAFAIGTIVLSSALAFAAATAFSATKSSTAGAADDSWVGVPKLARQPSTLGAEPGDRGCLPGMARINNALCIDRFEGALVPLSDEDQVRDEVTGIVQLWPANLPPKGRPMLATSLRGVTPQAYISGEEARTACLNAGKRLCGRREWRSACKGQPGATFPYGADRKALACNDHGRNPLSVVYRGTENSVYGSWEKLNDPRLNLVDGTVALTGGHPECRGAAEVFDMVGNLHEWIDEPSGTFLGGYYQDTHQNGDGCGYTTERHVMSYHDYSTGFRCCADAAQDQSDSTSEAEPHE
jgi:formylglycine-generating enzyme